MPLQATLHAPQRRCAATRSLLKTFVFMHTSTFNNDPFYSNGASARFAETTNDTGEVVALAVPQRDQAWKVMDKLNASLGRDTVRIFGAGQRMRPGSSGQSIARRDGPHGEMNCRRLVLVNTIRVGTKVRTPRTSVKASKIGYLLRFASEPEN